MSVNKVILVGNLGRDPELKLTQGGMSIVDLAVATSRKRKDKQTDEWIEETEWHRVTVFGKSAEACERHLSKGRQVYVEGRIETQSWEDKETGVKKYSTKVIADRVKFLGGRDDNGGGQNRGQSGGGQSGGGGGQSRRGAYGGGGYSGGGQGGGAPTGPEDDDIPF